MNYTIGADPELFAKDSQTGQIIGSERIVPELKSIVVRDGVQIELNPHASASPSILGSWISQAFRNLDIMVKSRPNTELSFEPVITMDPSELCQLYDRARIVGCEPSLNVNGDRPIMSDEARAAYLLRSAGGHLHFGLKGDLFDERRRIIQWMDPIVGSVCVLLDTNPMNKVRREWYGRAGEFRLQDHGVEYRTLSNFWLRNYTLMDFVFSLADLAIGAVDNGLDGGDLESRLVDVVDVDKVVEAIDTNNQALAWDNFKDISKTGLFNKWNVVSLMNFFERVQKNGLASEFPEDPATHWIRGKQEPFNVFLTKKDSSKKKFYVSSNPTRFSSVVSNG